ncbi:hypothetical protein M422DRAFT_70939 [Sphaerobolus stellatus SS14]|uniref:Uncharacterized protein n=1 Tax=Sphaerobolus stellatus (strain SS14) TaxID=990650 RepID=A0A0C9UPF1_SPHS4|nr:hypothetical protein M422DRAFT_70939 [Sphaerobolus stellatus SS14]
MTFHQILDLGQPLSSLPATVYESIFDTGSPLPDASDITKVDWEQALEALSGRIDSAIRAIRRFYPKARQRWLRLGNENGVMLLLRLVEFVRRVAIHHNISDMRVRIIATRHTLNVLLGKEAWRRWAKASLQLGIPLRLSAAPADLTVLWDIWMSTQMSSSVDYKKWADIKWRRFLPEGSLLRKMGHEAGLTVRSSDEQSTILNISEKEWQKASALASVKDWVQEMDESSFRRGSVIEKFQYIYAILMVSWWGKKGDMEPMEEAVKKCEDWLAVIIDDIDPTCLDKCKKLLSSTRFLSPPAKRAATPDLMDLDLTPVALKIPQSPNQGSLPAIPKISSVTSEALGSANDLVRGGTTSDVPIEERIVAQSPRKRKVGDIKGDINDDGPVRKKLKSPDDATTSQPVEDQRMGEGGSGTQPVVTPVVNPNGQAASGAQRLRKKQSSQAREGTNLRRGRSKTTKSAQGVQHVIGEQVQNVAEVAQGA